MGVLQYIRPFDFSLHFAELDSWELQHLFSFLLVFPDGQAWRSLDDPQASSWHQHAGQGRAREGVYSEFYKATGIF